MAPPKTGPAFKGSRLVRGPMAADHYTQIHNLAVRGAIPTRYVGVFGFISSHEEGWHLTAASVATQLEVGVDFVTSALHAIEAAGCLIRGRERDAAGKVRGSVWFVTDLPLQMRQLGIEDEALIAAQVRAAYEKWLAGAGDQGDDADQDTGEPNRENPILDVTSGNADGGERLPSSAPNPGFPVQAQPDQVQPVHKKNNDQEDQGLEDQEENPPTPRGTTTAPAGGPAATGGDLDEQTRATLNTAASTAAATRGGAKGWKVDQVAAAMRDALDGGHPAALVAERIVALAADPGTKFPTRLRTVLDLAAAEATRKADAETPPWAEGPFRYLDNDRPRCRTHPGHPADNCGPCRTDARVAAAEAADQHDTAPAAAVPAGANAREVARARAAAAKSTSRTRTADKRPTVPRQPAPADPAPAEPAAEPAREPVSVGA